MKDPKYEIEELDDGRYGVFEPDFPAPVTVKATCEEAMDWVRRFEECDEED